MGLQIASNMNQNQQHDSLIPVHILRNYGAGVLIDLMVSLGIATIVYANNILPFSLLHLIAWILLPLGIFTCVYAFFARGHVFYYLVWGVILVFGGLMAVTAPFLVPMTLIGVLLIVLAVIGIIAYWRKK